MNTIELYTCMYHSFSNCQEFILVHKKGICGSHEYPRTVSASWELLLMYKT